MKRSELKEAIKNEIKSLLSENRYDINDPNSPLGRLNDEYESSGLKGIVDNYGLDVVLMMLSSGEYGDRLNEAMSPEEMDSKRKQAMRGGGDEESLMGLVGLREDEMSDDEMDKKASRGAKKEPIGKEAERLAQVQKFMRQMQDKGIISKDKKILDTPKYKEEFAKFKVDLKKKKLEESI